MLNEAVSPVSGTVPMTVAPSVKVTVPVKELGFAADGVTVAVKVTCWPNTEGVPEVVTAVIVGVMMGVSRKPCSCWFASIPTPTI